MIGRMIAGSAVALLSAGVAHAGADQPLYQPQAAWVKPIAIPEKVKPTGAAADMLLWTVQDRLAPNDDESFVEQAFRIDAPEGLQQADKLTLTWNPLTDTLAIHRAHILREGKVIDLLSGGRGFTVLRRETSLEAAMIDGELTATLQPEGVQVGDVIDLAYTLTRREPALAGHSEGGAFVAHAGSIGRLYVRASWPAGASFRTWKTDDLPQPSTITEDGWTSISFDQTDATSPLPPNGAFPYDQLFGILAASDFKGWADVSATAYPLYAKAATLTPESPLKAEIARIAAAYPDAKGRTLAALQLVESQTRYLYVALDAGGYTPAAADLTWTRRFGDCKGKTVLLLALLKGLGVEAEPALVHTTAGDGLDRELPQMGAFDHVMVHATLDGRSYWLDATRMGDEDLDVLTTPNDHWALPVRARGAALVALKPDDPPSPLVETVLKVDARGGVDAPAKVHEELIFRRDAGWAMNLGMKQVSAADRDRALRQAVSQQYSWITPDRIDFTYDPKRMEAKLLVDGTGKPPFTAADGGTDGPRDWMIDSSNVGYDANLARTSDYHRQAPYQVAYPMSARATVEVELPDGGQGFEAENDDAVNATAGGMTYSRTSTVGDGRFVMVATSRAIAPSFPAAEAQTAEATLRRISEYPVSLRYTAPGPPSASASSAPLSPEEKGAQSFRRKDYAEAEADFTAALSTAPSAKLYYDRAAVRAAQGHDGAAEADLKAALKLDPEHALSLYALGRIDLSRGHLADATSHFSQAAKAGNRSARIVWAIATAYQNTEHFAEAVRYYDELMTINPSPAAHDVLLNQSCWTRAQWGHELDQAQKDCDEAVRLKPEEASYLDSRALVELRSGALDASVKDYDHALALRPTLSTSFFGRGVAEAKLGRPAQAQTDMAAAARLDARIAATFGRWGVTAAAALP